MTPGEPGFWKRSTYNLPWRVQQEQRLLNDRSRTSRIQFRTAKSTIQFLAGEKLAVNYLFLHAVLVGSLHKN